ncbi:MAG TPA: TonB-dependent receptor [Rhizobiaceae bacterium]|nr:TonB-dependent receptor [Rhizobiaceae bacterium]
MKSRIGFILAAGTAAAALVGAQAPAQDLDIGEIVVTPSRTPLDKSKVGSKVEKIDREKIEEQAKPTLNDYLVNEPGVAATMSGGPGQESTLSIRGAPKRYIKTLFNGIDIADPTPPNVQTNYHYLLADNLDSVEILKGSQSTLYGSDAIAGVVGISTLGDIPIGVQHLLHGEFGTRTSVRGGYGLRAASERGKVSVNLNGYYTDGISAADSRNGNPETDPYRSVSFDAAGEYRINDTVSIFGALLYNDWRVAFDDGFPVTDSLTAMNTGRQLAGRMGFNADLMDGRFRNTFSVQAFDVSRRIEGTSWSNGQYDGTRWKGDYQGAFDATDWLTFQFGADYERTSIVVPSNSASFGLGGLWFDALVSPVENLTLTLGARQSWHSAFGANTTWRATGSYEFPSATRLHASLGTGFRAPSLDELYGPFGSNPNLQPERSLSFDVGVEQRLGDRLVADLTYFHIDIDNLIGYSGGGYNQIPGTARKRGVEASLSWAANGWLDLGAFYTYTSAVSQTGARLPRVPANVVGLSVTAKPWERWTLTADARIALDTVDAGAPIDDYVLVNAKVAYKVNDSAEVYLRGENLLDQKYQTVSGYGMPGLGVFAGFRAKFGP